MCHTSTNCLVAAVRVLVFYRNIKYTRTLIRPLVSTAVLRTTDDLKDENPYALMQVFNDGMMDIDAYSPFPNAILFNWATIFVLGFGNLAALDFQVRKLIISWT